MGWFADCSRWPRVHPLAGLAGAPVVQTGIFVDPQPHESTNYGNLVHKIAKASNGKCMHTIAPFPVPGPDQVYAGDNYEDSHAETTLSYRRPGKSH